MLNNHIPRLNHFVCRSNYFISMLLIVSILSISEASADAYWKPQSQTPPRSSDAFANFKAAPCRDFGRTKRIRIYRPGDAILLEWLETRNQTGVFKFNLLRYNAVTQTTTQLMPLFNEVVDNLNNDITANEFHAFQQNFLLPTRTPDLTPLATGDYVLQLVHVTPAINPVANFYSCSDIRLENINSLDTIAPANVNNQSLTRLSNSIELTWLNPIADGLSTENLAYKVLVLQDTNIINITAAQLNNSEFNVGATVINATTRAVYVGKAETVTLANPGNANLFFKIFSYDVNGNYSSGVTFNGPQVSFSVAQGAINNVNLLQVKNGNIVITALLSSNLPNETFTLNWTSNPPISDIDGNVNDANFTIDSSRLDTNDYSVRVDVTGIASGLSKSNTLNFSLLAASTTTNGNSETSQNKNSASGGCVLVATAEHDPLLLFLVLLFLGMIYFRRVYLFGQ